jgi:hypothetical protein
VTIFMVNEDIACGMVCFFHQKKHSYLIFKRVSEADVKILKILSTNNR